MMSSSQELPADGTKNMDVDMAGAEPTPHSSQPDPKIQTFPWPRDWIDAPRHRTYRKPNKKSTTSNSQDRKPDTGDNKPRIGKFKEEAKALFVANIDGDAMDIYRVNILQSQTAEVVANPVNKRVPLIPSLKTKTKTLNKISEWLWM